jgi:hypothetical protein
VNPSFKKSARSRLWLDGHLEFCRILDAVHSKSVMELKIYKRVWSPWLCRTVNRRLYIKRLKISPLGNSRLWTGMRVMIIKLLTVWLRWIRIHSPKSCIQKASNNTDSRAYFRYQVFPNGTLDQAPGTCSHCTHPHLWLFIAISIVTCFSFLLSCKLYEEGFIVNTSLWLHWCDLYWQITKYLLT